MGEPSNTELKICVLGGGAAGLAVAKIFKDSKEYKTRLWTIDVFEEREDIGGTWLPAPATDRDVPPPTPMYDSIITNLPHPIMCYSSFWFPPSTPLFPKAEVVEDYLRAYSKKFDLMPHIHLSTSVISAHWTGSSWSVTTRTSSGAEISSSYDKLVIANGHYRVPFFPAISGLSSWRSSGCVTHSAWYRHPIPVGKKVLVVGGGYSGIDIAEEMSTVCETLVHAAPHSVAESHGNIIVRGARVLKLSDLAKDNGRRVVYFEDRSIEEDVDHIFLATGYSLSFPFLKPPQVRVTPPSEPIHPRSASDSLPEHLHNSGHHIFPLARFLFPLTQDFPPESAAFIGLPIKVAPLPLFEAQAHAVARVFADASALDVSSEIAAIHERLSSIRSNPDIVSEASLEDSAIAHLWHIFKGREQFDYRDALHALAGFTDRDWKVPDWVPETYENMVELRKVWKEIMERGEDEDWVRGVGEAGGEEGKEEWVGVLKGLLEIVKKRKETLQEEGKSDEAGAIDKPENVV